jgi:hypothetical protein
MLAADQRTLRTMATELERTSTRSIRDVLESGGLFAKSIRDQLVLIL